MKAALARAVSDWRWFFHSAAAEMGIRSSFGPMVQILSSGCGVIEASAHTYMDERRLRAARRHWRVEYALMMVDRTNLGLIRLSCEQQIHPVRAAFGDFGNLAHFTEEAKAARDLSRSRKSVGAWVDRLGMRLAAGRATKAEQLAAAQIRDGTEKLLEGVAMDYSSCRARAR